MKKVTIRVVSFAVGLILLTSPLKAQLEIKTTVYSGVELLNVIHLLSDSVEIVSSSYSKDVRNYFNKFSDHPAVRKARELALINCDFPIRHAWCFYDFPVIKLHPPDTLAAYNQWVRTKDVQDYFEACKSFYKESKFQKFTRRYQPVYNKWINTFNKNLYEAGMLASIDSFYRFQPTRKVNFVLGVMNCNSFALPETGIINPYYEGVSTIFVAYGNYGSKKDTVNLDFERPWSSQLIWHELGHVYLSPLYCSYEKEIAALQYIMEQDTTMKAMAGNSGWSSYLDENITQAVTSYLRIHTGRAKAETELERLKGYYALASAIITILQDNYINNQVYANFEEFFPVLLKELAKQFPPKNYHEK